VRYVVDRMCSVAKVTDSPRQCLIKQELKDECASVNCEPPDPASSRLFRVTVRVVGPKDTQVWTQALVTKGG
jgi:hypothetical protein